MSPDNTPPAKTATKDNDNNQQGSGSGSGSGGGGGRKTSSSTTTTRPPEHGVKCPRCDSPNTKFCYYNNYSLTQPRHFCKTCRRYWTKGGALRNVPIGGGCRKKNKMKSSRISCDSNNSGGSSSSDQFNGLKFLHGLSPSVDFHHLGGLPFPRLQLHQHQITSPIYNNNHFSSYGETSSAPPNVTNNLDPSSVTLNYPFSSGYNGGANAMNMNIHSHNNLASSIESLSSINQDLHWKLQQQRLATLFGGENQKENNSVSLENGNNQSQKPQPILFQNLEVSKSGGVFSVGNSRKEDTILPTEWFFGNSYGSVTPTPTASSGGPGPAHENATNWSGGVHAWSHVQQQYSSLP